MKKDYVEVDPRALVPGTRVEVRVEAWAVRTEAGVVHLRMDDGSTWGPFLPTTARVYEVTELRFCLVPGRVVSRSDGEVHFVSVDQLAHLYDLRPGEWRAHNGFGVDDCLDLRHLHPRHDGQYGRPSVR